MSVGRILQLWPMAELDFQQVYGIDLAEPGLLQRRTLRWVLVRLVGLLSVDSRIQRVLNPTPEQRKAQQKQGAS